VGRPGDHATSMIDSRFVDIGYLTMVLCSRTRKTNTDVLVSLPLCVTNCSAGDWLLERWIKKKQLFYRSGLRLSLHLRTQWQEIATCIL